MNKIIITSLLLFTTAMAFAQNAKYEETMKTLAGKINQARYTESLIPLANQMERIASAEKTEWLPNYWVAYCNILESIKKTNEDERDLLLDKAETYLKKADALTKNNDEMELLKAYYFNGRMIVSPMTRFMKYGGKIEEHLEKTLKLNPNNPRAHYMEAQGIYYKPVMFGGGEAKAKPMLIKAKKSFEAFKPKNEMMPLWGMETVNYLLSKYKD